MTVRQNATTGTQQTSVRSILPCLAFTDQAEEAVNFYVSVFKNSRIVNLIRMEQDGPIPKGKVLHVDFELNGREFTAFDGGSYFSFNEGISLVATCDTQEELDEVWSKFSSGGEEGPCGWLKDRFGVSWQIVPTALGSMMSDSVSGNPERVMEALLKMGKLDIQALEDAYRGSR